MHTNTFELFVVHIALKRFMPFLQGIIRSDNSLTVANVNHQGGTRSGQLLWVAKNPLTWAVRCLQSTYLLGEQNQVADFLGTNPMGPHRRGKGGSLCFWGVSLLSPMAPVLIQPSWPGCSGKRLASDPVLPLLALPANLHCSPFKSPKICINFDLRNNGTSEMC